MCVYAFCTYAACIGAFGGSTERSCMKGKLTRAMTTFHGGGSCKHMCMKFFKCFALGHNSLIIFALLRNAYLEQNQEIRFEIFFFAFYLLTDKKKISLNLLNLKLKFLSLC